MKLGQALEVTPGMVMKSNKVDVISIAVYEEIGKLLNTEIDLQANLPVFWKKPLIKTTVQERIRDLALRYMYADWYRVDYKPFTTTPHVMPAYLEERLGRIYGIRERAEQSWEALLQEAREAGKVVEAEDVTKAGMDIGQMGKLGLVAIGAMVGLKILKGMK